MRDALLLAVWMGLWMLGGLWLAGAAFRLEKNERLLVGLAAGLALENLLANLLARFLPFPSAVWSAAGLTTLSGLSFAIFSLRDTQAEPGKPRWREWVRSLLPPVPPLTLAIFIALSLLGFGLGRGLGIFDDFSHLTTISLMATGEVPPRFVLDPAVPYEYHYFLLLSAAQVMRVGSLPPWTAVDLMRGLVSGLALCLAFFWTRRMTRSSAAGALGAAFVYFASGARWLLLLLPPDWLHSLSGGMDLLGSAAATGTDLSAALASPWAVEGSGTIPFPFAFTNGIIPPGVLLQFVANGLSEQALVLALLLVFNRRRGWAGSLAAAVFVSSMALLTEAGVVLELGGLALAALAALLPGWIAALRQRSGGMRGMRGIRLPPAPRSLWIWLGVILGGHLLGSWQGGALWGSLLRAAGLNRSSDYRSIGFTFTFPPTVVSSHLGVLSLGNPGQLLTALAELGPLLLALPLLFAWGWKAARAGRWYEASLAGEAFLSLGALFIQFAGSEGIRNTSRLYRFAFVLVLFTVPLAWNWLKRRGAGLRWTAAALAGAALLGGLVMFGVELPGLQKPVYTYFISAMDASIFDHRWNQIEPGALVFDLEPYRAPTILGRYTNSSTGWYTLKPEWKALFFNPLPTAVRAYGFSYAYMDNFNFAQLDPGVQKAWETPCVRLVEQASYEGYWRRLYDIRGCQ
jgi:hypothetical protein